MIFIVILFLLLPSYLEAANYWARPGGTLNACTASVNPPATNAGYWPATNLNGVASCLSGGDTLFMRAGTYTGTTIRLTAPSSASFATGATITNYNGEAAIVRTQDEDDAGCINLAPSTNFFNISGFDCDGQLVGLTRHASGFTIKSPTQISGVEIHNWRTEQGISVSQSASWIHGNRVHDNGANCLHGVEPGCHGIYSSSDGILIEGNEFYNHSMGSGVQMYGYSAIYGPRSTNIGATVRGNFIHDNQFGMFVGQSDMNVYNNVITNGQYGVDVTTDNANNGTPNFYNNSIRNFQQWCGVIIGGVAVAKNNICWDNPAGSGSGDAFHDGGGTFTTSNNLLHVNPSWRNASGNFTQATDLQLTSNTSAAYNYGTNTLCPATDYSGNARPQGGTCDAGAFEFLGQVPPVVAISLPTGCVGTSAACTTSNSSFTLSGSVSGTPGSIAWACVDVPTPRCGSGGASWTPGTWTTIAAITFKPGKNVVTVTATDNLGAIGAASITITYAPTFPGNTLAGSWAFKEGSGTSAADSSGNGNTAALNNGPTWVAGKYDTGVQTDGVNDNVTVQDAGSLRFTQSFTVAAWVNLRAVHSDFRAIAAKNGAGGAAYSWVLYASIDNAGYGNCVAGASMIYIVTNGTSGPSYWICGPALSIGVPVHIAASYSFSTLALYIDGVLIQAIAVTGYMESATGTLEFAGSQYNEYLDAYWLDEPHIYNFALPLGNASNTVPGAACTAQNRADQNGVDWTKWSIIGAMNCQIIAPTPPLPVHFPADATGLKSGATAPMRFGAQ